MLNNVFGLNTLIIELDTWFTWRWLELINNYKWLKSNYIETDLNKIKKLKKIFLDYIENEKYKIPNTKTLQVLKKDNFIKLQENIFKLKEKNDDIKNITILDEWLLIYLSKEKQNEFFNNLRFFSKKLKTKWLKTSYLTTNIPSHENFTNWLVHEWFTLKDHLDVMQKVDPKIINALHNTEQDFFRENSIATNKIKKYYYDELIMA